MQRRFLIVSQADDLHALAVQAAVRRRGFTCDIVEADALTGRESINFALDSEVASFALIRASDGTLVDVSTIDAIWWRRFKQDQQIEAGRLTEDQVSLINNDCFAALVGSLQSAFKGKWISSPEATDFASNKLNQLTAARLAGFRIPDTIVTQSPAVVREFHRRYSGHVIVKPVAGTRGPLLFTRVINEQHLLEEESIRACPAIYQECIPGTQHIRLNCFGCSSYAGLIESDDLDWRPNLNVPISCWTVPASLACKVRSALDILGLDMGIVDLKITTEGEIVWFEVNPQGQFLFLEGLTGEPLTEHFAEYFTSQ